jgi:hypothetical protein
LYYAELAKLNFSNQKAQAEAQRGKALTEANYAYNRGSALRAEPLKLTANRNAANTAGLAESGVLAKQQGQIQTQATQGLGRLAEQRRTAIENFNTGLAGKEQSNVLSRTALTEGFREKGIQEAEALGAIQQPAAPAATPAAAPKAPIPPRIIGEKPQRVTGSLPHRVAQRRTAARKAIGVG